MTFTRLSPRNVLSAVAISALVMLPLTLTACAPEPTAQSDPSVSNNKKGQNQEDSESTWNESSRDDYVYTTELPASFPTEFLLPANLEIVDTGARSDSEWFLVVRTSDQAAADAFWNEVISANGFAVGDEQTTAEGGKVATLSNATFTANALTITNTDGSVDISYDIKKGA